jgi:hypothetical protein
MSTPKSCNVCRIFCALGWVEVAMLRLTKRAPVTLLLAARDDNIAAPLLSLNNIYRRLDFQRPTISNFSHFQLINALPIYRSAVSCLVCRSVPDAFPTKQSFEFSPRPNIWRKYWTIIDTLAGLLLRSQVRRYLTHQDLELRETCLKLREP